MDLNIHKKLKKTLFYIIGLLLIALGINISKLSKLGISPASSIPAALNCINPNIDLGTTTQIFYIILILLQFVISGKNFKKRNIFGLIVAVIFGWMINITGLDKNAIIGFFGFSICKVPFALMSEFATPTQWIFQLAYSLVAVVVIGIGVFLYLKPSWVSMPPEGLAQALSYKFNKKFGDCKSAVDSSIVLIALIMQCANAYIKTGNVVNAFIMPEYIVCREGTIIAAMCVGQVVKFLAIKCAKK